MSSTSRTLRRMEKYHAQQIYPEIRKILWEQWDPIGVNDSPETFGEYDGYAPGIYALLRQGASDADIAGHLQRLETEAMEIPQESKSRLARVIRALRAIDMETPEAP